MAKQLEDLVACEYGKDGNLLMIFPRGVFEAIESARVNGLIEDRGETVQVAIDAGRLGYRLKALRFVVSSDQPPCCP